MPGVVIAGTHSGCGKTTVTLGLLAALKEKGLEVQPFKTGPDFIDAGLHRMITGRHSRNLDLWMCGEQYVKDCYERHSADADISVVEGVMGLYDGALSTATLASRLGLPVILVIDAYGMAETAGAIVRGFVAYGAEARKCGSAEEHSIEAAPQIAGVILNRIASKSHLKRISDSIEGIPVLGYLPRELRFEIPHRHLGLTVAEEEPIAQENIGRLADAVLRCIDVDRLMRIVIQEEVAASVVAFEAPSFRTSELPSSARIAVAYDKAFCFYYEDNLDLLRTAGAEIVRFSPLSDPGIPDDVAALYIGGGYPELHAEALSANRPMIESIRKWADSGKPLYAECGGLMYLSRGIHDFDGNFFGMAGVLPFETRMKKGRSRLGYRKVTLKEDCLLGKKGAELRGHEFHYSEIRDSAEARKPGSAEENKTGQMERVYSVTTGADEELQPEGFRTRNTLASYIHIHFGSNPAVASNIVRHMRRS
jgi:cobyrinic acid a,c-diamide synthase